MQTVSENINDFANSIQNLLQDLLLNHSSIYHWNTGNSGIAIISISGDYSYEELKEEGRQIQAQVLASYRRYFAILSILLKDQPKDTLDELSETNTVILNTIEQDQTWCKNTQIALDKANAALQSQIKLLTRLYDSANGETTYIPDTNALIYNPAIEAWTFSNVPQYTIVLLPTVLSELDKLKINHRNEAVRKKAEMLTRKIKEYRRRGKLTVGVPIVKGRSMLLAIAIEPKMTESLPWLDHENNDDRIITGIIEVMRMRPRSPVICISRDINFQNKAEYANIPYIEPPEPQ